LCIFCSQLQKQLVEKSKDELLKLSVTVIYRNLPPRSEVAGIKPVGVRELLQLRRKLPIVAFHLLDLLGTKRM
jgi:hypothetical protein